MTHSENSNNTERRRLERKYLLFYLRVLQGDDNDILGHLVNFSAGGLMLLSDTAVKVPRRYHLRLRLPAFTCERSELTFDASSCWCHRDVNPEFYLTGYQVEKSGKTDEYGNVDLFSQLDRLENFTRIYRSTWNNSLA